MLVELGMVDVNVINFVEGVMVLYGVVYEGNVDCIWYFLENGVDVNV